MKDKGGSLVSRLVRINRKVQKSPTSKAVPSHCFVEDHLHSPLQLGVHVWTARYVCVSCCTVAQAARLEGDQIREVVFKEIWASPSVPSMCSVQNVTARPFIFSVLWR